jgi:hypothetical protein
VTPIFERLMSMGRDLGFAKPALDQGAHSRNSLYVLLGVWLAIGAFAVTIFAVVVSYDKAESVVVAPFAAAAVYTLVVIGYLLLRQWHALEESQHVDVLDDDDARVKRGQTVKVTTPSVEGREPHVTFYYVAEPDGGKAEAIIRLICAAVDEKVEAVAPIPKSVIKALRLRPGEASHA